MLLTNPNVSLSDGIDGGDGSFLHEDVVVERVISSSVPQVIYAENAEFIDGFSQTLINYSPISININDYWNKVPLRNVVIPIDDKVFDDIDESKIIKQAGERAFFVNSMLNLQDKLAFVYMNNFYTTASNAKTNHFLNQKMTYLFKKHQIPEKDRQMMFKDINDLFKTERFITNKEFNTKKGKEIALTYAARSAWEAEMEGALTTSAFFADYITNDVMDYSVESTILPDIWNAFVKPIAHPLGFSGDYKKICKVLLTDRVLGKIKTRADGVSVKCTHKSLSSPFVPPPLLLPWGLNDDWTTHLDQSPAGYDPYDNDTWTGISPYDAAPTMDKYVPVRAYEGQPQNQEGIQRNEKLSGPWDPNNNNPEMFFATADGYNLWPDIQEYDEGQGNILEDVQTGYGEFNYAGYTYTKYIFENRNYLIEYTCYLEDGTKQRIIEYYRYDLVDASVMYNTVADNTWLPRNSYPDKKHANIINGTLDPLALEDCNDVPPNDPDYIPGLPDCAPLKSKYPFVLDDEFQDGNTPPGPGTAYVPQPETSGLDIGHYSDGTYGTSNPATTPSPQVTGEVTFTPAVNAGSKIQLLNSTTELEKIIVTALNPSLSIQIPFNINMSMVFVNGVLIPESFVYTKIPDVSTNTANPGNTGIDLITGRIDFTGLTPGDRIEVLESGSVSITETTIDYTVDTNVTEYSVQLPEQTQNISIYKFNPGNMEGKKIFNDDYEADGYNQIVVVKEVPVQGDIITVVAHHTESSESYDKQPLEITSMLNGPDKLSVEAFIDGIKIKNSEYTFITGYSQWTQPGGYKWETDTNVYQINPVVIDVNTLIARFIQTRDCMVNVYNLREEEDPSIKEEFSIRRIPLMRNIIDSAVLPNDNYIPTDPTLGNPHNDIDRNTGVYDDTKGATHNITHSRVTVKGIELSDGLYSPSETEMTTIVNSYLTKNFYK